MGYSSSPVGEIGSLFPTDGGTTWNECSTQNIDTNGCTWLENGSSLFTGQPDLVMDPFNP